MNVFATDHPLVSQSPSWFDVRAHPRLSFVCSSSWLALLLAPLVLARLYYYAISDTGAEPNPFPQPWWALFFGSVLAFALSYLFTCPAVLVYRFAVRKWSRQYAEQARCSEPGDDASVPGREPVAPGR